MARITLGIILSILLFGCAPLPPPPIWSGDPIRDFEVSCMASVLARDTPPAEMQGCMDAADRMRARRAAWVTSAPVGPSASVPAVISPQGAAVFATSDDGGETVSLTIKGLIVDGDSLKVASLVGDLPARYPNARVGGFVLDSPGGSLSEARYIARRVAFADIPVFVPPHGECSSACFLILAAAKTKFASRSARVGVHSVIDGSSWIETTDAKAATTEFARVCASLGVPPPIIGRMVTTSPGRIAWLSDEELTSMGVRRLPAELDR